MRYHIIFSLVGVLACQLLLAQENTVAGGGNGTGAGGSSSFSIGQIDYINASGTNGSINQGVQQPLEFYTMGVNSEPQIQLQAYPNPTNDICWLVVDQVNFDGLSIQLHTTDGKLLQEQLINSTSTELNFSNFSSGIYNLQVYHQKQIIKTFKIVKP